MLPRMTRRTWMAVLAAAAALVIGSAPASAAPGDATARVVRLTPPLPAATAVPTATADANGPTTAASPGVHVPGVLTTGRAATSAEHDEKTGGVRSGASATDVRLHLLGTTAGGISADLVEAECSATQKGFTGGSTLTGLDLGTTVAIDPRPAPNTTVELAGARLVLNEQLHDADGGLTVNALHLTPAPARPSSGDTPAPAPAATPATAAAAVPAAAAAPGSGDLVLSSATCGPAGLPVPMASGAGLGAGLGLLALFAVPAAAVAVRRRHEHHPATRTA